MEKVIRKPDPTAKRKNIYSTTFNKIKVFLKEQLEPVYKSEISRQLGIDYNSLNLALCMLNIKTHENGMISILKGEKKRR